ncbi:cytochrome o ubiquinol oxidase subunit IV [Pantoea sp. App145]|uniref:cytochrome o ubiquinol oxidase subunit IV n=1 Tax=Pantoea sp. App145 TaxID=3071567 RepID=UPI003A7F8F14
MGSSASQAHSEAHGTYRSYITGFVLCVILTLIPFMLVMYPVGPRSLTLTVFILAAVAQLLVQMVFFLHLNRKAEGGWNLASFIFTLLILLIVIGLSIWIIWSMHYHMMIRG